MPRNQIQFEDDEPETDADKGEGREVDLDAADAEDELESKFDDIPNRLSRKTVEDEDEGQDLDDEDNEELKHRGGKQAGWRDRLLRTEKLVEDLTDSLDEQRERNDKLERTVNKAQSEASLITAKAEAETKLVKLRKELAEAMEAGNTADTIRLQEEMADIKADVKAAEKVAAAAPAGAGADRGTDSQPRRAKRWMAAHPRFNTDPAFKAFAQAIDKQVAAEGHDANSQEYWDKVDARIKKRYPEEYRGEREPPTRRKHPASGGEGDESQGGNKRTTKTGFVRQGSKVRLTEKQLRNMARFGMDPENAEDQKEYIRNNIGGAK